MPGIAALLDIQRLAGRLSRFHRCIVRALQMAVFLFAGVSAFLLRFDFSLGHVVHTHLVVALAFWVSLKVPVFHVLGLDRGRWRYTSVPDLVRLTTGNLAGSALASLGLVLFGPAGFPRSVLVLDLLLSFMMTGGIRLAVRVAFEVVRQPNAGAKKRILIYGAGDAGVALLRELRQNPTLPYELVGLIDDSPDKAGAMIHRMQVLGGGPALPALVQAHDIDLVFIAMPTATGREMCAILQHCHEAGVSYKTVPGMAEIIASSGLASQIRDVAVEDLLGRNPIHLDESRIRAKIERKVILVTGAAGSIGSELCRQICRFDPDELVAFEISETALFHLDQEIRQRFPKLRFSPEIGSIQDRQRLREVFRLRAPSVVYHTAAYKHVPMMEAHPFEAVENNVFGTYKLATVAAEFGIEDFVMISSDKAVRPTNIMGATKRVAELIIRSLQNGGPRYVSVRFGNVLGSNGSVVPIFKRQIAAGGPVSVTHPDMRRYFMTIPEAAQLVLQASTMGKGGELFVLDMGKPVRITELARQLILLSGLKPDIDIRIEFTGLRPGEKLYEELNLEDERTLPACHEKVKAFDGTCLPFEQVIHHLAVFRDACEKRDLRTLLLELKEMVPDYNPSKDLLQRMLAPDLARLDAALSHGTRVVNVDADLSAVLDA